WFALAAFQRFRVPPPPWTGVFPRTRRAPGTGGVFGAGWYRCPGGSCPLRSGGSFCCVFGTDSSARRPIFEPMSFATFLARLLPLPNEGLQRQVDEHVDGQADRVLDEGDDEQGRAERLRRRRHRGGDGLGEDDQLDDDQDLEDED